MAIPTNIAGDLQRVVTSGQENITSTIDNILLPFEDELRRHVHISGADYHLWMGKAKDLLESFNTLTVTYATLLLDPSLYNDAYASEVLTELEDVVLTNLSAGGTGLPTAWETNEIQLARNRILFEATREVRRIVTEISKRVPYAGIVADMLQEADRNVILLMADKDKEIVNKQYELAYQNARDVIKDSMELEKIKMEYFERRRDRSLRAYVEYDRNEVMDHWKYFEYLMGRALDFAKTVAALMSLIDNGHDQLTFQNWMEMSKTMADGQLKIAGMISNMTPGGTL